MRIARRQRLVTNGTQEYITAFWLHRKSDESIVAMKWGNAHGAKGFCWL